jgi:hypothetical protein
MAAQAISIGMPKSTSMFRALLWKEWRQQRWLALPLAVFPALLYVVIFLSVPVEYKNDAPPAPVLITLLLSVIVGASAFCGERDDETAEFLRRMPSGGLRVFLVKALTVWGTIAVTALLLLAVIAIFSDEFHSATREVASAPSEGKLLSVLLFVGSCSLGLACLAILPALVSAWARRTLPCILLSVAAAVGLWAGGFALTIACNLATDGFIEPFKAWPILAVPAAVLVCAPWFWNWARTERTVPARIMRAVWFVVGVFVISIIPVLVSYTWFTFFAPLSAFRRTSEGLSPSGRWISLHTYARVWAYAGGRTALVDVEDGTSRWLTRVRSSYVPTSPRWSPSGKRAIIAEGGVLWPLCPESLAMLSNRSYWLIEPDTGARRRLEDLKEIYAPLGISDYFPYSDWMNDDIIAASGLGKTLFFNVESGESSLCAAKPDFPNQGITMTARGGMAFDTSATPDGRTGYRHVCRVWRFAPDLSEAQETVFGVESELPKSRNLRFSPDGKWALLGLESDTGKQEFHLLSLAGETGAERISLPVNPAKPWTDFEQWLPDSSGILFWKGNDLVAYDVASRHARFVTVNPSREPFIRNEKDSLFVSPSGRYVLVQGVVEMEKGLVEYRGVGDLKTGEVARLSATQRYWQFTNSPWVGDEYLLLPRPWDGAPYELISRDGMEVRKLLAD